MKFLHTADWHIGKKLNGYDLLEDQRHAFNEMMKIAEKEQVNGIVLAGDLYDRAIPSVEAVETFNQMLQEMNIEKKYPIFAISGNHDSAKRLETGGPWFEYLQFYLHTRLEQSFTPVEHENIQFFLLPYFEPFHARKYFENDDIRSIESAMKYVIEEMKKSFKPDFRQVLVAHFFMAESETSDSETKLTVGGLDVVPMNLLEEFDYVALGHLHNKNASKKENVRYSGSLLKYSLSEVNQEKGVQIVEIAKGGVTVDFHAISPLRELVVLEESFATLMSPEYYQKVNRDDFIAISLTDKGIIPNVMNQLRTIYPRIIQLDRAYGREIDASISQTTLDIQSLSPVALFEKYFEETTGEKMTVQQQEWVVEEMSAIQREC